jgi:hypothetical protein
MCDVNTKDTFCDVLPEITSRLLICFCVRCEPACLASIRDDTSLKRLTITNKQLIRGELERRVFGSTFVIAVFVIAECEPCMRSKLSKVQMQENQLSAWRANRVELTVLKQFT